MPVNLQIYRCGASLWQMLRQHHYLNGSLGAGARCYVAVYQDRPIGFIAVVHTHMRARYYRVTRLVVLPDYQGIGVGKRLLNFFAELYTSQTKIPFCILTSNPQIVKGNMKNWVITRYGHASRGRGNTRINSEIKSSLSRNRITVSLKHSSNRENICKLTDFRLRLLSESIQFLLQLSRSKELVLKHGSQGVFFFVQSFLE